METTTLDDRSRNITYSGGTWNLGGVADSEFNGTTTWTVDAGSVATITFLGSQISVFGTVAPPTVGGITNASYSIDDNNLTFVTWVQQAAIQYQQLFFQSNHLSPTSNHTLKITNIDGKLILDFVNITSVSTKTTATKHLIPLGKIVGGILGGVFSVVVAITVGLIFLKRKKNCRHQKADGFPLAQPSMPYPDQKTKNHPTNIRNVAQGIFTVPPPVYT